MDNINDSEDDLLENNNTSNFFIKKNITFDPFNSNKHEKVRYQRTRETTNIIGYVVNVHDSINFDIDLTMSSKLQKKYKNVITNQYKYYDYNKYYFDNIYTELNKKVIPQYGITYRCRLKGIGMKQSNNDTDTIWKSNKLSIEIKKLIDITDGWITCTLSDVDIYKRLLVDIYINTPQKTINLSEYLLEKTKDDTPPFFHKYLGNKA